jgi:hypothetical protein
MRFEVEVGADLETLHKARDAYNAANAQVSGFTPADDMPTFVQRLIDNAVAGSLEPFGPTTLSAALQRIAELEASKVTLEQEVTAMQPAPAVVALK